MLPIGPIIFLASRLAAGNQGGGQQNGVGSIESGRQLLWALIFLAWASIFAFGVFAAFGVGALHERDWPTIALLLGSGAALTGPVLWPFEILRRVARRGHYRFVYYVGHLWLVFARRNETYPGACLLAALALAHRGNVTSAELDWLLKRISKNQGTLGTAGAAFAMYGLLAADLAKRSGRIHQADELTQSARILLGTMTYMSPVGAPKPVMKVAYELLALDDARRGNWGGVLLAPDKMCTAPVKTLRAFVKTRLEKKDDIDKKTKALAEAAKTSTSPVVQGLFNRVEEPPPPRNVEQAREAAVRTYLSLVRREPASPRDVVNMIATLDIVTHPEFPETILPEEIKADAEAVDALHEEIASAIAEPLQRMPAPIFVIASRGFGPISARVFQKLEMALFSELERAAFAIDQRYEHHVRRDPFGEWLEVSYVRSIYRRIQATLGDDAARHVWPVFCRAYCRLGVQLSETWPPMRPLAHAVFRVLHAEAVRFEDVANVSQQQHNLNVTAGLG